MKVTVITLSDRAYHKIYADRSGKIILSALQQEGIETTYSLIPDDPAMLKCCLNEGLAADWIITCGGTGLGSRDVTPEVTQAFCDRAIPGLAEYIRLKSFEQTPFAAFSRGYAGSRGKTIIVNLPGSEKAAVFGVNLLLPLLEHGTTMLADGRH